MADGGKHGKRTEVGGSRAPATAGTSGSAVERRHGPASPAPGKRSLVQMRYAGTVPIDVGSPSSLALEIATEGTRGAEQKLPYLDHIQASFGDHDVRGVSARVGGAAALASQALGAEAYTAGDQVAFRQLPDLHTAAHEATHIVQQRGGLTPDAASAGGFGGDRYERQADQVAGVVASGGSAKPILDEIEAPRGCGPPSNVAVQRLKLPKEDVDTVPRFARLVRTQIPKCENDTRLKANLTNYGSNSKESRTTNERAMRDIPADLAWGHGPTLRVSDLPPDINGRLIMTELNVARADVDAYEQETDPTQVEAHELFLESTILHEYTHFLDHTNRIYGRSGEVGADFERATYGKDIDDVSDAIEVLHPMFEPGEWSVVVEGMESRRRHRVSVSGAVGSPSVLQASIGASMTVQAVGTLPWQLRIEYQARGGWYESKTHKVREGVDNYLVRSENSTDRDMDDLEVRVVRVKTGEDEEQS